MPREHGFYTVAEAAAELGLQEVTIRSAIRNGTLTATRLGKRLLTIAPAEVDRYRLAHQGGQGWDKRKDPAYQPSTMAQYAKEHRRRQASVVTPAPAPAPPEGTTSLEPH